MKVKLIFDLTDPPKKSHFCHKTNFMRELFAALGKAHSQSDSILTGGSGGRHVLS